ncbi:MAG: alpha/beta hydrolase [Chloroflexi bacterium]|nr:alpha/beta hydrolase [Chloroflexota bacterium]
MPTRLTPGAGTHSRGRCGIGTEVLALDLRGHGETSWSTEYSPELLVEDIAAFTAALGLEQFTLVGFSIGAHSAYQYAARHPAAVERLILVEVNPQSGSASVAWLRSWLDQPDSLDEPEDAVRSVRAFDPRATDEELRHWVLNNLRQRNDGCWTWRYDPVLRSASPPNLKPDAIEIRRDLGTIACPTLLVHGAESEMSSREEAEQTVRLIPGGRLVHIEGAGHWVPMDHPAGFLATVEDFLDGTRLTGRS